MGMAGLGIPIFLRFLKHFKNIDRKWGMNMQKELERWISKLWMSELLAGKCKRPGRFLGLHQLGDGQVILTYRPCAWGARVIGTLKNGQKMDFWLDRIDNSDLFGYYFENTAFEWYELEYQFGENNYYRTGDPYRFSGILTEDDLYLFTQGINYHIYEKFGAHPMVRNGVAGTNFAVWAPNARGVQLVGDFNLWDGRMHQMNEVENSGVYELFLPGVGEGAVYKYQILTADGSFIMKADPYANMAQLRPDNASVVVSLDTYEWSDKAWIENRQRENRDTLRKKPMSIYEVHPGSWRKVRDNDDNGGLSYRELAHQLADYLKEMGYTHVELMGIAEYPFDGSWGYQVTGYYAPTRRYGTPQDFMYFVDYMHKNGIHVILDWVPAHFPKDAHGLARFDGQPLYEHPDPRRGEHPHWGTYIFNYGRKEVENFLTANAFFWLEKYHIDGLRVDAVASMLYLDYGKNDGEWLPNEFGGKENIEAMNMLNHLNGVLEEKIPGAVMIAEESTSWSGVTAPAGFHGLGFLYKWNMGWMNDFLSYISLDPYFRQYNHGKLTFSMMYAYSENFILVLSHDEVVHGKGSLIEKMPGDHEEKFANLRTAYAFFYGHPGKKLLFMGQEFAQYREWSEKRQLDWWLLGETKNREMQYLVKSLNRLYQEYDALYYNDHDPVGFEWMGCKDGERSIVSFVRRGSTEDRQLLFVCNFTPVVREDYRCGVPCPGTYREVLNTDSSEFGGHNIRTAGPLEAEDLPCDNGQASIVFTLPGLSVVVFEYDSSMEAVERAKRRLEERKEQERREQERKEQEERALFGKEAQEKAVMMGENTEIKI